MTNNESEGASYLFDPPIHEEEKPLIDAPWIKTTADEILKISKTPRGSFTVAVFGR